MTWIKKTGHQDSSSSNDSQGDKPYWASLTILMLATEYSGLRINTMTADALAPKVASE